MSLSRYISLAADEWNLVAMFSRAYLMYIPRCRSERLT